MLAATASAQSLDASMGPQLSTGSVFRNYTFTFSHSDGIAFIGVVNILVNNSFDGAKACYLAYRHPTNTLYLMDDSGSQHSSTLLGVGVLSNTQCTVNAAAATVEYTNNEVILKLPILYVKQVNSVFWLATRSIGDWSTSGWLISGVWLR